MTWYREAVPYGTVVWGCGQYPHLRGRADWT